MAEEIAAEPYSFSPERLGEFLRSVTVTMNSVPTFYSDDGTTYTYDRGRDVLVERPTVFHPVVSPAESYQQISANDKGKELLQSLLTPDQKHQLDTGGYFLVTGSKNGLYRINCTNRVLNVTRLHRRTKKFMYKLCAGPTEVTPNDFWLAQKLMIEADERAFLKIANKST